MATRGTIDSLLIERAAGTPEAIAYTYLPDRGEPEHLSFAALAARACEQAARLAGAGAAGRPVLLALEHPVEYATSFFACLLAGAIPASASAPQRPRLAATAAHLSAQASDCGAELAIGSPRTVAMVAEAAPAELASLRWLEPDGERAEPSPPANDPEGLAYLQYTSGSTGRPKAVALAHRSLLANLESQRRALGLNQATRIVTWLPLSHDMGFVAPVLQPLALGCRTFFLAPTSFLLKPVRWLEAIGAHRGTLSAAPNFAYELTVRRVAAADRERLDLSSWEQAVSGAEPVRAETLARFSAAFAAAGFRPRAFAPCFGMAEATCMATCSVGPERPVVRRVEGEERVSCGPAAPGTRIEIVDPETRQPQPEGEPGEVWLAGPSLGLGYFGRAAETAASFGARLTGEPETAFLRSGDLGFTGDGELFVSGRLKDLIIVRGRNYLPQDIEATAAASHPGLTADAAAVAVATPEGEGLAVIGEVANVREADCEEITAAVKAALSRQHGLRPHLVALLEPGALPKTTSGKVRRRACRAALDEGRLDRALSIVQTGAELGA